MTTTLSGLSYALLSIEVDEDLVDDDNFVELELGTIVDEVELWPSDSWLDVGENLVDDDDLIKLVVGVVTEELETWLLNT